MPDDKKQDMEKLINPTTMAGARRLMADPKALDEAIERGLSRPRPEPTFDGTRKR